MEEGLSILCDAKSAFAGTTRWFSVVMKEWSFVGRGGAFELKTSVDSCLYTYTGYYWVVCQTDSYFTDRFCKMARNKNTHVTRTSHLPTNPNPHPTNKNMSDLGRHFCIKRVIFSSKD